MSYLASFAQHLPNDLEVQAGHNPCFVYVVCARKR